MGYHISKIEKGEFGEVSKIREEVQEIEDAEAQNNRIMVLVELSDLVGAIQGYLDKNCPGYTMEDLIRMAEATASAFQDGTRE